MRRSMSRCFKDTIPRLGDNVYIDPAAAVIGDVTLGHDVSVWPMAVIRGDVHRIEIGAETNVQDGSVLHVTHAGAHTSEGYPLVIGCGVTIGHRVVLHGCSVGDHCLIGIGAIVMDGARLEGNLILGAGTLVPPGKQLEGGFLYVGSPVRQVRPLRQTEMEFLYYSSRHYVQLKNQYLGMAPE